jgi:hypothetical protein
MTLALEAHLPRSGDADDRLPHNICITESLTLMRNQVPGKTTQTCWSGVGPRRYVGPVSKRGGRCPPTHKPSLMLGDGQSGRATSTNQNGSWARGGEAGLMSCTPPYPTLPMTNDQIEDTTYEEGPNLAKAGKPRAGFGTLCGARRLGKATGRPNEWL